MSFFDIRNTFFTAWGNPVSYIEFFGVVAGAIAVWLAAKANILNWPLGIVNIILFFFLFFQVQLYPDMFLQAFYFVTNVIGWWRWTHPRPGEEDRRAELKVSFMSRRHRIIVLIVGAVGTFIFGGMASRLHEWLPAVFNLPSAYPYLDSFVTVFSVITTFLVIQKKIECWILWILIDIMATGLYYFKGIKLASLEYLAFCFIASYGLWYWIVEYRSYQKA